MHSTDRGTTPEGMSESVARGGVEESPPAGHLSFPDRPHVHPFTLEIFVRVECGRAFPAQYRDMGIGFEELARLESMDVVGAGNIRKEGSDPGRARSPAGIGEARGTDELPVHIGGDQTQNRRDIAATEGRVDLLYDGCRCTHDCSSLDGELR